MLAPALLLAGLLAAEATAAIGGYLIAYGLFIERGPLRARLGSLAPLAVAAAGWHLVYRWLGYGVFGAMPHYISPFAEPGSFARAVVERGPLVLFGQWVVPLEWAVRAISSGYTLWLVAVAALAVLALALWPLLARSPWARFWALGQLLAVVPLCATAPHERHGLLVGIGTMGLLATLVAGLVDRPRWAPSRAVWRVPAIALAGVLLAVHGLVAPFRLPVTSRGFEEYDRYMRASADSIPDAPGRTLVILNAPDFHGANLLPFYRLASPRPMPARIHRIAPISPPIELSRPDAHTLVARSDAFVMPEQVSGTRFPMAAGQRIRLTGITAEVIEVTADGRPRTVAFHFDVPLEDRSLGWLAWHPSSGPFSYAPIDLPRVGETRRLP
jgi:hypothetical protein